MNFWFKCGLIFMHITTSSLFADNVYSIIPSPVSLRPYKGVFKINPEMQIVAGTDAEPLALMVKQMLEPATGLDLNVKPVSKQKDNIIILRIDSSLGKTLGSQGYKLIVSPQKIELSAAHKQGLYYGIVTLKQLLPAEIYKQSDSNRNDWNVPCVRIEDYPRFQWRGMHLDVCRHFMPKEFVKKYIDLIAMHKMNIFHWHLTEDQGWRIEIKKYPKLTQVGAWRKETLVGRGKTEPLEFDGIPHGGFYTQEEIREIVAYAKERYITVVPEIEMPGHSTAALAAYPEFSCTGGPFEVLTRWGVLDDVYCVGNDKTIEFLQDVLAEVLDLFPSEFIHIGGDECPKKRWKACAKCQGRIQAKGLQNEYQLQSWFIQQIDTFLTAKGRRLVGWDEILEGGLAPGATVMHWRSWLGEENIIAAAKTGHDMVMTPNSHAYFDHYQADPNSQPLAIGGFTPLQKVYNYEPIPDTLTEKQAKHILGAQGQVWTEYIPNPDHVEYMALPRMCALAEVVWTPSERKDYDDFYNRLTQHAERLKILDVNFHPLIKDGQKTE